MNVSAIQCGHDPLFFSKLEQWVMTTLDEMAIIVKEPKEFVGCITICRIKFFDFLKCVLKLF